MLLTNTINSTLSKLFKLGYEPKITKALSMFVILPRV
jgi:hypothetical protein